MSSSKKLSPVMLCVGRSSGANLKSSTSSPPSSLGLASNFPPLAAAAASLGFRSDLVGAGKSGTPAVCFNVATTTSVPTPPVGCGEVSRTEFVDPAPPAVPNSSTATSFRTRPKGVRQNVEAGVQPWNLPVPVQAAVSGHLSPPLAVPGVVVSPPGSIYPRAAAGQHYPPPVRQNVDPIPTSNSGAASGAAILQQDPLPGSNSQPVKSFAAAVRGSGFVRKHASDVEGFGLIPDMNVGIAFSTKDGNPAIDFEENIEARTEALFNQAIVIKFLNGRPSLEDCHSVFSSTWGFKGQFAMGLLDSHTLLLRLELATDVVTALSVEASRIKNFAFKIYRWNASFNGRVADSSAPVWITLPKLPINCFVPSILKAIGNGIGKFLRVDLPTSALTRPSAARMCVEVNLKDVVPRKLWIGMYGGFWQSIEYDRLPLFCSLCSCRGHSLDSCKRKASVDSQPLGRDFGGLEAPIQPHPFASAAVSIDGPVLAVHDSTVRVSSDAAAESMSPTFLAPAATVLGGAAARVPVCTAFAGPEMSQSQRNRFSVLAVQQENVHPTAAGSGCVEPVDRQGSIPPDSVSIPFARPDLQAVQSASAVSTSVNLRPVSASAAADVLAGAVLSSSSAVHGVQGPSSVRFAPVSAAVTDAVTAAVLADTAGFPAVQFPAVCSHASGSNFGVSSAYFEPNLSGSAAQGVQGPVSAPVSTEILPVSAPVTTEILPVSAPSAAVGVLDSVLSDHQLPTVIALAAPAAREPVDRVAAGKLPAGSKMVVGESSTGVSHRRSSRTRYSSSLTSESDADDRSRNRRVLRGYRTVEDIDDFDKLRSESGLGGEDSLMSLINQHNFYEEDYDLDDSLFMSDEEPIFVKPKTNKRHPSGPLQINLRNRRR